MNASLISVSGLLFKRPNPEYHARKGRRYQAELPDRSTPLGVRTGVATPEAQKRGKRCSEPQKRLSKQCREKKRCQATAQEPPRDVISRPLPPFASSSAGCFKPPPSPPPKVPSWTSIIPALNEPPVKELPTAVEDFRRQLLSPLAGIQFLFLSKNRPKNSRHPHRRPYKRSIEHSSLSILALLRPCNSDADLTPL